MKSIEELNITISKNIAHYRKLNHLTQAELAEKISYSDKAVSKWERGESMPDIYVLTLLSDIFNITVNDLISVKSIDEMVREKKKIQKSFIYNKIIIATLASLLPFFVAVVCFVLLSMRFTNIHIFWISFIYAIPISAIIWLVFAKLYWKPWVRFIVNSILNWSIAVLLFATIELFTEIDYSWLLFIISAAYQVLVIFWYMRKRNN